MLKGLKMDAHFLQRAQQQKKSNNKGQNGKKMS